MNATTVSKTDFIKFNVSPTFKALAQKKAASHGMSLSELGRMLFGTFVTQFTVSSASPKLISLSQQAKRNYEQGKITQYNDAEDAIDYLHTL